MRLLQLIPIGKPLLGATYWRNGRKKNEATRGDFTLLNYHLKSPLCAAQFSDGQLFC